MRPHAQGAALAEVTGGSLVTVEGGGHGIARARPGPRQPPDPRLRRPGPPGRRPAGRGCGRCRRPKRALYVSSPIGLGHARRDVAIAAELRRHHPDLQIDWLAQHPVTEVLRARRRAGAPGVGDAGQRIGTHRGRGRRARPPRVPGDPADGRDPRQQLHGVRRRRRRRALRPRHRRRGVGRRLLPAREPGAQAVRLRVDDRLRRLAADARRRRRRGRADRRLQRRDDRAASPVPRASATARSSSATPTTSCPTTFGAGLPAIRDWTEANYEFAGYVTGFDPAEVADREALRAELGYRPDEQVCIVSVGGSGVGADLVRRVVDAVPAARRLVAGLRVVVVTGPRIDPAALPAARGRVVPPLRPGPPPPLRGVRPGGRAGRPDDLHGAHRQPAAVRVRPAASPLRAEVPRPSPAGALRRRAAA